MSMTKYEYDLGLIMMKHDVVLLLMLNYGPNDIDNVIVIYLISIHNIVLLYKYNI